MDPSCSTPMSNTIQLLWKHKCPMCIPKTQTHNCARNFQNIATMINFPFPSPTTCRRCHARLFYHESNDMCCIVGRFHCHKLMLLKSCLKYFQTPRIKEDILGIILEVTTTYFHLLHSMFI